MSPRPETKPSDCWDWITPDEVMRHALAAYYAASREVEACPAGEQWLEDGVAWSSRAFWRDWLVCQFLDRLASRSEQLGIPDDSGIVIARPGKVMAQGCAVLSPAVGPAQEADQAGADTPNADPLFLDHEGQELPAVAAAGTQNTPIGGAQL